MPYLHFSYFYVLRKTKKKVIILYNDDYNGWQYS